MSFANVLVSLASPIAKKVFLALGLSVVTYTGLSLILNQIQVAITTSLGGMAGNASQLLALFGFYESTGIILAAVTTRLAMTQLTQWIKS